MTNKPNTRTLPNRIAQKWEHILLVTFPIIAVAFVCLLFFIYDNENNTVHVYEKDTFSYGAIENVKFKVESTSEETGDGTQTIKGWFVMPGVTYRYYNYGNDAERDGVYNYLNICFIDGENVIVLPTKLELRDDVSGLIADGIDYKYSGFQANVPKEYSSFIKENSLAFLVKNQDGQMTLYE